MRYGILAAVFLTLALIGSIRTDEFGDDMLFFHVNVVNDGAKYLDDLMIRVLIYDLGIVLQTSNFDLQEGDTDGKFLFFGK